MSLESHGGAIGIETGYGLDNGEVGLQAPVGSRIFASPYRLRSHPTFCPVGTRVSFPGALCSPLTSN
jgi:hypothetical protein